MPYEAAKPDKSSAPLKRWWPQYSLRAFLVVVTLVCLWLGWEANRARRQKQAVEEVLQIGGVVRFDYQFDEKGVLIDNAQPSAPAWLRESLGEDHFRKVVTVDLSYGGPRLGDDRITNERVALIEALPDLTTLEVGRALEMSDEGLAHLRGLTQLKTLYLYNTSIEGPGLRHLSRLKRLELLTLHGAPVTDEGLSHLAQFPRLRGLSVGATRITDDGLKYLAAVQSLRDIQLSDTDITDAGLEHLKRLRGLTRVSLSRTDVTAQGVSQLQAALPKCTVIPTAEDFDRKPVEIALWPEGKRLTAAELMKRAKGLGIDLDLTADANRPGSPIVSLRLFNSDISADSLLRVLAETPELEVLNLRDLVAGDDLLKRMPVLPKLRYLSMMDCRVTDAGVAHLTKHVPLKEVELDSNYITDQGLAPFMNLPNLERLSFTDNRATYKARLELKRAMPRVQMPF